MSQKDIEISVNENDYQSILLQTVAQIEKFRSIVAMQACSSVSNTYWAIGKILYEQKLESSHGDKIIKRLSVDLKQRYPKFGASERQLWNMKKFFVRYMNAEEKLLRVVALLPWSDNLILINKKLTDDQVFYYAQETIHKGWNRDLLLNAIKLKMHEKINSLPDNNFQDTLPVTHAKYANEVFHDSYNLGFLGVSEPIAELELEHRLVEKIKLFLLELGKGFSFIGNQHELEYNGKTSKVDMLFFHRGLRCLVAVDLKIGEFLPEYVGKMNYYLSLLDRIEKQPDENPSIGIILCAEKNHVQVELALEDIGKPIGVSDYQLILPKDELQKAIEDEIQIFKQQSKK